MVQNDSTRKYSRVAFYMHFIKKILKTNGLQGLISVSKTELRSMSADLSFPFGADVTKYGLIKKHVYYYD